MAQALSFAVSNQLSWGLTNTTSFGATSSNSSAFTYSKQFTSGTGAGAVQKIFIDLVSVANGSPQSYDLSGTSINDPLGTVVAFTNVKGLYIEHTTTTATGNLTVSGNFLANTGSMMGGTSPTIVLKPGGSFFITTGTNVAAGYTVTNSTGDVLTLTNADAAAVSIRVLVVGE